MTTKLATSARVRISESAAKRFHADSTVHPQEDRQTNHSNNKIAAFLDRADYEKKDEFVKTRLVLASRSNSYELETLGRPAILLIF